MNALIHVPDLSFNVLLAKTGLIFCNPTIMIAVFLLGFLFLDSKAFSKALMLLLFTMVYNFYLKSIWQIPLKPPLEGWAFPSGHMHAAWVFWGFLAWHYKRIVWFLAIVPLMMYGMIHHGYHDIGDLLGAIGFGTLSLFIFHGLNKIPSIKDNLFIINVIVGSLALIFLFMIPMPEQTKPHLWFAQGGLMGMAIGWLCLLSYNPPSLKISQKLTLSVLCLTGMAVIYFSLLYSIPDISLRNFYFVKGFALTLWVIISQRLLAIRKRHN